MGWKLRQSFELHVIIFLTAQGHNTIPIITSPKKCNDDGTVLLYIHVYVISNYDYITIVS